MNVQPFLPDGGVAPLTGEAPHVEPLGGAAPAEDPVGFGTLVDLLGTGQRAFARADAAERSFVAGSGDLQAMVLERARADMILSAASAASGRATQAIQTILNMQV